MKKHVMAPLAFIKSSDLIAGIFYIMIQSAIYVRLKAMNRICGGSLSLKKNSNNLVLEILKYKGSVVKRLIKYRIYTINTDTYYDKQKKFYIQTLEIQKIDLHGQRRFKIFKTNYISLFEIVIYILTKFSS